MKRDFYEVEQAMLNCLTPRENVDAFRSYSLYLVP